MRNRFTIGTALLAAAMAVAGCASTGVKSSEVKSISSEVWAWYQQYLFDIGKTRPGAFAVSQSGNGAFYQYCQDIRCAPGSTYKGEALKGCRRVAKQECYVFAFGRDIEVNYKVRE